MAQAGLHNAVSKTNIVLRAGRDLAFSLDVKRERRRNKQFQLIGQVETIVFEQSDRNFTGTREDFRVAGRRLYWPSNGPWLARTTPEEDLIFATRLALPLPMIADASDDREHNPYEVDQHGESHLKDAEGNRAIFNTRDSKGRLKQSTLTQRGEFSPRKELGARRIRQNLEDVASGKYRNFLVFQPVAQIILMVSIKGRGEFAAIGSHRYPISSMGGGVDGRKLALLIDPSTGEAFFTGGRYAVDFKALPEKVATPEGLQPMMGAGLHVA